MGAWAEVGAGLRMQYEMGQKGEEHLRLEGKRLW